MSAFSNTATPWAMILSSIIGLMLIAATFAGWMFFGSAILLDLAASGLSWCF